MVSAEDLVNILTSHSKMKGLRCETNKAYVERETGAISGIERAIQAATAPTPGQQMLQRGSRSAVADGVTREQVSVSVNPEGGQVVERLVERGVILPAGLGVHIQQSVQQVVSVDSELGKRKIQDDMERVELRLRNLECSEMELKQEQMKKQFSIDNAQLVMKHELDNKQLLVNNQLDNERKQHDNKIHTMHNFAKTMEMLDPQWRNDKRLILQAKDYMENNIFKTSSVPQIENGAAYSSASVSICTVAMELGITLSDAKGKLAGRHAAKLYRDKYKQPPSKHHQTIRGTVLMVNSYTQKDRDLLETAIKAVA